MGFLIGVMLPMQSSSIHLSTASMSSRRENTGGIEAGYVVSVSGCGVGDPLDAPGDINDDLNRVASGLVLARPQGFMLGARPARQNSLTITTYLPRKQVPTSWTSRTIERYASIRAVGIEVPGGGSDVREHGSQQWDHRGNRANDGRLGGLEGLGDVVLVAVATQVDQGRFETLAQAQGWWPDALGLGQSRQIPGEIGEAL